MPVDAVVVGSGPAAVITAYGLEGREVLLLDVGRTPPGDPGIDGNLFELRQRRDDLFAPLIGQRFESLRCIEQAGMSLKLKAPYMAYVIEGWEQLSPIVASGFGAVLSFARGGLANAWGAGVYRFSPRDLEGFPLTVGELDPYYDELTDLIGISGASDDLDPYFGSPRGLQEPMRVTRFSQEFRERYSRNRDYFRRSGIHVGTPRLAVLTRDHRGRRSYQYENNEFFKPLNSAIYNPAFTLDDLIARGKVRYLPGKLVLRYRELPDGVEVLARDLSSGALEKFDARALFLTAGALGSARLVLQSRDDYQTRLPLLDNPMSCIPLFRWTRIGSALETSESSMAQLNLVYDGPAAEEPVQASFYCTTGPLRTDILFDFPLTISANLLWAKYVAPAMGLVMTFYASKRRSGNDLRLRPDGALEIRYTRESLGAVEAELTRAFRKAGYWSSAALCRYPAPGSSLHYAGLLPMRCDPGPNETTPWGLLHGSHRVYCTDGACFSALPAKNLTFTIMANALRIARRVAQTLA